MMMLLFREHDLRATERAGRCDKADNRTTMQHHSAPCFGCPIDGAAWKQVTVTSLRQLPPPIADDLASPNGLLVFALRDQFALRAIANCISCDGVSFLSANEMSLTK